jgi:hypothetical protein
VGVTDPAILLQSLSWKILRYIFRLSLQTINWHYSNEKIQYAACINKPFKDETKSDLYKESVRTAL